jgi:hypothetical protein
MLDATLPITRNTLFAIEARLVAARRGADAIAAADAEVPPSSDPRRLSQARQATEALYGRAPNPFAGWSRAELSAIVYDESGAYTINERYAAANQRTELDQKFWAPVFQRALDSGDWKPVITAALVFYASSCPEQTAYPDNYAQLLQQYMDLYQLQPRKRRCRRNSRSIWRACWKRWCCHWDRWPGRRCHPGSDAAAPGAVIGRTDRRRPAPGRPDPGQQCRPQRAGQRLSGPAATGLRGAAARG